MDFVDQVSGVTLLGNISYFAYEDILLFSMEYGHSSCSIGNTLKNPSKASACSQTPYPWAFRLKDWVQESFSWGWNVSAELIFFRFLGNRFSEGYFPAETFHNAYPSAGMPTGRVFAEWLKDLKEKKAFRHVDTVMEKTTGQIFKSSCSFNENVLFFFLKTLFFSEKNRIF